MTEGPAGVVLEVPAVNEGPPVPASTVTPGPVVVDDAVVFVVPVEVDMIEGPAWVVLEDLAVNGGPPVPAPTVTPGPVVVDDAGVFVVPVEVDAVINCPAAVVFVDIVEVGINVE